VRLLPLSAFEPVFGPLAGQRCGLIDGHGNVGDHLLYRATRQLLDAFGIDWIRQAPDDADPVDVLLLFGGGNLGSSYTSEVEIRRRALRRNIPAIVLPQSLMGPEPGPFLRVYVRERASLWHCPQGLLAPELALGYNHCPDPLPPDHRCGVFLRSDAERAHSSGRKARDPARLCRTPAEYLALAGRYAHIVTDRLHFAICGLLNRRRVTLLPNSYHKNRSLWETWLRHLGCEWADDPTPFDAPGS
jgi:hypothetical protein